MDNRTNMLPESPHVHALRSWSAGFLSAKKMKFSVRTDVLGVM